MYWVDCEDVEENKIRIPLFNNTKLKQDIQDSDLIKKYEETYP